MPNPNYDYPANASDYSATNGGASPAPVIRKKKNKAKKLLSSYANTAGDSRTAT